MELKQIKAIYRRALLEVISIANLWVYLGYDQCFSRSLLWWFLRVLVCLLQSGIPGNLHQARTNQAPGFPLRTGLNGLEVDHQWGQTKMAAEEFVVAELDPNAVNAAQAKGGEGKGNWRGGRGGFPFLTMWWCDGLLGPAHCGSYK
jgi:hypothetical protein